MQNGKSDTPGRRTRIRSTRYYDLPRDQRYQRLRDLPRLLPVLTEDLETDSISAHRRLIAMLKRALRNERVRSRQRHWTYDPARHAALARAARIESAALRRRCVRLGIPDRP